MSSLYHILSTIKTAGIQLLLVSCLASATSCQALSRFRPADQKVIASRELARLGLDALRRGNPKEAEIRLVHALKQCPYDAEARHCLARVYRALDRPRDAIEQLDLAVQLSGGDPGWTVELGESLLAEKEFAVAEECARRAIDAGPHVAAAWSLLGDVCLARRDFAGARTAYYRALASPDAPDDVLLSLARVYEEEQRPQRALAMLRRYEDSVDSAKHPPELPWRQGKLLQSLARYEDALVQFHAMQQTFGSTPELLRQIASCQQALGQWRLAEQNSLLAAQLEAAPLQTASLTTDAQAQRN